MHRSFSDGSSADAGRPQPRKLLVLRYEVGMEYGTHVDDAVIAGARTDLSFTLFLSTRKDTRAARW